MMNTNALFEQLIDKKDLNETQMKQVMHACMRGELSEGQICAFLALMRAKGETVDELTTAAHILLDYAHPLDLGEDLIDIVGTGGDGQNTFNVSTAASIVASAAGAKVAKHGNRSVSSQSGSADLLILAGIKLDLSDEQFKTCLEKTGLCFLFAPHFHPAMQYVRNARKALGIRSFFNLLGPLINPAHVKKQVVGVYDARLQKPIAQVLKQLGSQHALVIHSQDGLDEISVSAPTDLVELKNQHLAHWQINPGDYGLFHDSIADTVVNSPDESLAIIEQVFSGQKGAARDMLVLNTAAALYCAGLVQDIGQGVELAQQTIDTGKALSQFYTMRKLPL